MMNQLTVHIHMKVFVFESCDAVALRTEALLNLCLEC